MAALRHGGILCQQAVFHDDGHQPCHLPDGVRRYGGLRWHAQLVGLGLKADNDGHIYRKVTGIARAVQRARFRVWRSTGLWLVNLGRERQAGVSH